MKTITEVIQVSLRLVQVILRASTTVCVSGFWQNTCLPAIRASMAIFTCQWSGVTTLTTDGQSLISDYTFEKDALFAEINLGGDELEMYYRVHEALAEKIITPDLIVYLRANTDLLMARITQRDRSYERNMERDYIAQLNHGYDDFFLHKQQHTPPVLVIESDTLDFVRYADDLRWIENRIRQTLEMTPFQPELPLPLHDEE